MAVDTHNAVGYMYMICTGQGQFMHTQGYTPGHHK